MKAFLLPLILFFSWVGLGAQNADDCDPIPDFSTGFEACPVDFNGILNGCAPGWFPSTGSPFTIDVFNGITPYNGNRMVVLVTGTSFNNTCFSEGMFLDVSSLTPGQDYELRFWVRTTTNAPGTSLEFNIDYTSGLSVGNGTTSTCLSPTGESLYSNPIFSIANWTEMTVPIQAKAGFDQVHIYPNPNDQHSSVVYIDDVSVALCNPCENVEVDAYFRLNGNFLSANIFEITPTLYDLYDNIGGQHTWVVYRSQQPNGPYTYLTTYTSDDFTYYGNAGWYYTVLHRVETDCGTHCYGWNICGGCGGIVQPELCEYCGPIDCSIIEEPCTVFTPDNLRCNYSPLSGPVLTWDLIPGATYEVEFTPGGRCCRQYVNFFPFVVGTNKNSIPPPQFVGNCFTWRVRAVCDKSVSEWSNWQCTNLRNCGAPAVVSGRTTESIDLQIHPVSPGTIEALKAVPNPSSGGSVTFVFTPSTEAAATLSIYTIDGRQLYAYPLTNDQLSRGRYQLNYNSLGLKAGTYFARINTSKASTSTRFIVAN